MTPSLSCHVQQSLPGIVRNRVSLSWGRKRKIISRNAPKYRDVVILKYSSKSAVFRSRRFLARSDTHGIHNFVVSIHTTNRENILPFSQNNAISSDFWQIVRKRAQLTDPSVVDGSIWKALPFSILASPTIIIRCFPILQQPCLNLALSRMGFSLRQYPVLFSLITVFDNFMREADVGSDSTVVDVLVGSKW